VYQFRECRNKKQTYVLRMYSRHRVATSRPFAHVAIDYQSLTALEQWKTSRHWLL